MLKNDTKLDLAEALLALSQEKPFGKISVSDIISRAGKNRKTFYYHFADKSQLVAWFFRYELGALLEAEFSPAELVYEETSEDPCSEFPYYVFAKKGVRSSDGQRFIELFAQVLEHRRSFYEQTLREEGPGSLDSYLYQLYLPAIRRDILFVPSSSNLHPNSTDFLSELCTSGLLSFFRRRLLTNRSRPLLDGAEKFADILFSPIKYGMRA